MAIYTVFNGRLQYSDYNRYAGKVLANDLHEVKARIKKSIPDGGFNLNPFYAVILDETGKVVHNAHLQFQPRAEYEAAIKAGVQFKKAERQSSGEVSKYMQAQYQAFNELVNGLWDSEKEYVNDRVRVLTAQL